MRGLQLRSTGVHCGPLDTGWLPLAAASSLCLSRASASCCLRTSAFCCSRASALTRVLKTVCRSRASASADWRPLRSSGRLALTRPKDSPFALPAMGIQFCSVASACQEEMHAIASAGAARACGGRYSEMRRKERRGGGGGGWGVLCCCCFLLLFFDSICFLFWHALQFQWQILHGLKPSASAILPIMMMIMTMMIMMMMIMMLMMTMMVQGSTV